MMGHKRSNNQDLKGGAMKFFVCILLLLSVSTIRLLTGGIKYDGLMPAVEVVAQRYNEDDPACVGVMPEVTVTALRCESEDEAWSGLMPEVVVTAVRPALGTVVYSEAKKSGAENSFGAPAF
jgi:hypothetical protein